MTNSPPSNDTLRVVSVSGGKDSMACAVLALEQYPRDEVRLIFCDTGNEHEATYDYVTNYMPQALGIPVTVLKADFSRQIANKAEYVATQWREEGVPEEKVQRALAVLKPTGNPYLDLCLWKGRFPSRMAQFCTTELKTLPATEYHDDLIDGGYLVESWQGVRADESLSRRHLHEREYRGGGLTIYRPILAWTAQQTVDYVRSRGHRLNPLYSQGMGRVGCMPCINARKSEIAEIARRFPEHVERIAEWERLVGEASKLDKSSFFPAPTGDNRAALRGPDIHAQVRWARTLRGGKEADPQWETDGPACASAYGLCE